jgi:hypothetical protein
MRESTIAAPLIGFMALGGCAKVRYPNYYALKLPNPVFASRNAARIPANVSVREFRAPQCSAKLQNVKTGDVMWSETSFKTSDVNQRSLPAVVTEMSRNLSEAPTQLVSSMRSQVSQSAFRAAND